MGDIQEQCHEEKWKQVAKLVCVEHGDFHDVERCLV